MVDVQRGYASPQTASRRKIASGEQVAGRSAADRARHRSVRQKDAACALQTVSPPRGHTSRGLTSSGCTRPGQIETPRSKLPDRNPQIETPGSLSGRHELEAERAGSRRASTREQGRQDSNLQPPVLETGALPIELRPWVARTSVASRGAASCALEPVRRDRDLARRPRDLRGSVGRTSDRDRGRGRGSRSLDGRSRPQGMAVNR